MSSVKYITSKKEALTARVKRNVRLSIHARSASNFRPTHWKLLQYSPSSFLRLRGYLTKADAEAYIDRTGRPREDFELVPPVSEG